MRKNTKKSMLFVDFPMLISGVRYNLYELFANLRIEFDEIRCYSKVPKEREDEKDCWSIIRVATSAGAFPTLCPSDCDPYIVEDIRRAIEREDLAEIAILSGDNGFSEVLATARKRGFRVKAILPLYINCHLLKSVAEEVKTIADYASEYIPEAAEPKMEYQIATTEERSVAR